MKVKLTKAALRSLNQNVNESTRIAGSYDHALAVEMFYKLKEAGEKFNPVEIQNYMIGLGWKEKV